jgi:hypothetical protein
VPGMPDKHYRALLAGLPPPLALTDKAPVPPVVPKRFAIAGNGDDDAIAPKKRPRPQGPRRHLALPPPPEPPEPPVVEPPRPLPLPPPGPEPVPIPDPPPEVQPVLDDPPAPPPVLDDPLAPPLEPDVPPPPIAAPRRRGPLRARRGFLDWERGGEIFCDRAYRDKLTGKVFDTWFVKCPNHDKCSRTRRVVPAHMRVYGELEPLAFLDAWKDFDGSADPTWQHVGCEVPVDALAAKMALPEVVAAYQRTVDHWSA